MSTVQSSERPVVPVGLGKRWPALQVGQVGVGNFGKWRRGSLRESGLFELAAIYDWNKEFLAQAESEEKTRACRSYEELLDTPGLDAVIICTGAKYHAEQAIAALKRGLPVFVEKPLCSTREELCELLTTQRESGVPVSVGHCDHRSNAVSRTIKNWIEAGEFGEVVSFEKTTAHSGGLHIKPGDWRGDPSRNPGGMLFQCGVHDLHELMFYFGPITEISSCMRYDVHESQTADAALCFAKFTSGVVGTLCAYHVTPYRHTLSIFGTRASLYRDERYHDEGVKFFKQKISPTGGYEPLEALKIEEGGDPYGNIKAFYKAVRSGEMQYPSLVDGALAVSAVFAAEESASRRCAVRLDSWVLDQRPVGTIPQN